MHPTPFAVTLFDFNVSPQMISVIVPVVAMFFGGVMAIVSMYFSHQRKKLWHETARLALERGQPLPPALEAVGDGEKISSTPPRRERHDLRTGLILIAVSAGIWVFLRAVGAREAATVAAIPGFLGLAFFLLGLATVLAGPKSPGDDRPRQP